MNANELLEELKAAMKPFRVSASIQVPAQLASELDGSLRFSVQRGQQTYFSQKMDVGELAEDRTKCREVLLDARKALGVAIGLPE